MRRMGYSGLVNYVSFGRILGLKNLALFYSKKWASFNLPVSLPVFGAITHKEELLNIRDNILGGSIRDRGVERDIRSSRQPVIVDCGINVGVTVRWWYYLNPQATVYGIDMMQEAHDFTAKTLPGVVNTRYVPITAVLQSETGSIIELKYNDPLFGGNRIDAAGIFYKKRRVSSVTLDDCLGSYQLGTIDLLKVDIEESAAQMFQGASKTLSKVKHILLEIHTDEERDGSIRLLNENGFHVRRTYKRHLWFARH